MNLPKRRLLLLLPLSSLFAALLLLAEPLRGAVQEALRLCALSVIPALFPFLVLSSLLISLGFGELMAAPMDALMALFRLPGEAGCACLLGMLGGYPIGARTAAELCESKVLSTAEGERLLTFVNNASPAFLISVLGIGIFGSVRVGVWLWLIHLLSALLTGLLLGRGKHGGHPRAPVPQFRPVRLSEAFLSAVQSALISILSICAFVCFFYPLTLPLRQAGGLAGLLAAGVIELFSAAPALSADAVGFILAAGLAGWGGLSVLCQTAATLAGSGLSLRPCLRGKALQAVFSVLLALLLQRYVLG